MTTGPLNIFEYEALAKERLPSADYDYIAGGGADEITLRRNRAVFDSIMLRPRVLVDISQQDMSTTVLGTRIELPVMADPSGHHTIAHPDGELATARATGSMGTVMVLSSSPAYTLEGVAQAATGPIWFQQYLYRDPGLTKAFANRAEEAGYTALCVTLDATLRSKRERDTRNNYTTPLPAIYAGLGLEKQQHEQPGSSSDPVSGVLELRDKAATWPQLEWLAANTSLPLVAKGIMTAEDARLCVEHGAKALIISNHGGRQLDTTFATIEVLPEIVKAVDGRLEVYLDGGIRRGTDVLKALALGARAVLIGRPLFWGLAVDGEAGVRSVFEMLRHELDIAMGMSGRPTIDSIDISLLGTVSPLTSVLSQSQDLRLPQL